MIDRARVHRLIDELLDALGAPASPERTPTKRPKRARVRRDYQPRNQPSELDVARARAVGRKLGILRP